MRDNYLAGVETLLSSSSPGRTSPQFSRRLIMTNDSQELFVHQSRTRRPDPKGRAIELEPAHGSRWILEEVRLSW